MKSESAWKAWGWWITGVSVVLSIFVGLGTVTASGAGVVNFNTNTANTGSGQPGPAPRPERPKPLPAPVETVFLDEIPAAELAPAAEGRVIRFVELSSAPLADAAENGAMTESSEAAYRDQLRQEQADFLAQASAAGLDLVERHNYQVLFNGLAVDVAQSDLAALESLDSVAATYPVYQYMGGGIPTASAVPEGTTRENVTVTNMTHVPEAHAAGFTGAGVTIGIIDGGIDYNHPALGGPGFPNSKVIGGWDFADNDDDPFDDRNGTVAQHGTHVSGIVAGSDDVMIGVAPDAKLRVYRVFGTANPGGTEDIIIAAMERAADDGCNVINMSLGQNRSEIYQQGVFARATDNIAKRGVVPVIAAGNSGTAGPFLPSTPAIAKNAIAVAAAYNTNIEELAFRLADDATKVAYQTMYPGQPAPGMGSDPVVDFGVANCAAIPEGISYDGQVVLVQQGSFSCRSYTQINLLAQAGATAVIWWQNTSNAFQWPSRSGSSNAPFQIPAVVVRRVDVPAIQAQGNEAPLTWGFFTELAFPLFPGLPTFFSSWGPSHELDFKPDVMAPGGYVFSTIPMHAGSYGLMDGTSMSSPHVAGIVALVLSANPDLMGHKGHKIHDVRNYLMNTSVPAPYNVDPALGLEPAARQGAGMVDAMAAIAAVAKVDPEKIALHDLRGATRTETIKVENKNGVTMTYNVSHVAAISAAPPFTSRWVPMTAAANVTVSPSVLVVPAGGSANLTATFRQPSSVPGGTILSGWIELAPVGGGKSLRVPYMGLKGAYQELPAINPTFVDINTSLDNPSLRSESRPNCTGPPPTQAACCRDPRPMSCGWSIGKNLPQTLDYTNNDKYDDACTVMVSQGFPLLRKYRARVLDASGKTVAWGSDRYTNRQPLDLFEYWVRNSGAGTGIDFAEWYGDLEDGSPAPAGTYYIRLEFDKFQGDGGGYPDFETWTSPAITIVRP